MSFRIENKKQNRMSCLDIQIIGEDKKFTTSVYFKPTFSGVYTHWESFYHVLITWYCLHFSV